MPAVLVLACGSSTDGGGDGEPGGDGDGDGGGEGGGEGDPGGDGDGSGGALGTVDIHAACTTEASCIVRSGGEGRDSAWLENEMARCSAEGFGSVDRPGTWHDDGECPEGDYFASCTDDDSAEHFLLVDYDKTLEERKERCTTSGGVWETDDAVEPVAIKSIDAAEIITPLSEYHPDVLTTMHPNQLCSTPSPGGLVGISETVSGSIAEYFNFVCAGGKAIQNINDFTQSASERYSLASEAVSVKIVAA